MLFANYQFLLKELAIFNLKTMAALVTMGRQNREVNCWGDNRFGEVAPWMSESLVPSPISVFEVGAL